MKINLNLLKKLYLIEHSSRNESTMMTFIINYCYKIPGIYLEMDHYNNIFITKNTSNPEIYPCIVAHMDEVHQYKGTKEIVMKNGLIWAKYKESKKLCGLGADDANGIYIALELLNIIPNLKICFTTEEEIGGNGAYEASINTEFFENCQYLIQADRRGKSDLIVHTNGVMITSDLFLSHIVDICDKYEYSSQYGVFTDVGILAPRLSLSGINVSCGYYNEHTVKEYTNIKELENCLNFIHDIVISLKDQIYPIKVIDDFGHQATGYDPPFYDEEELYNYYKHDMGDEQEFEKNVFDILSEHCSTCKEYDCIRCHHYTNI